MKPEQRKRALVNALAIHMYYRDGGTPRRIREVKESYDKHGTKEKTTVRNVRSWRSYIWRAKEQMAKYDSDEILFEAYPFLDGLIEIEEMTESELIARCAFGPQSTINITIE